MRKTICFLCCATLCHGADWSSLYDTAKLQAEKARLQTAVDVLIQKEIQPFLSPQQAILFGLQAIELPLNGRTSDPLDAYAEGHTIILPIRTLLFVEDLARAYGWLWANRYGTRTIDEYVSMLRYRSPGDFPNGKYPTPLTALHIPENALTDPRVVDASVRLRRNAYAFLLLHQFAHLQLHHEATPRGFTEIQEEDADQYALNIMKENSVTPTGIYLALNSALLFETGEGISQHPITPHRLVAMSHYLDLHVIEFIRGRPDRTAAMDAIHNVAYLLMQDSEFLSLPGHQQEVEEMALKTSPETLQPRPLPRSTK